MVRSLQAAPSQFVPTRVWIVPRSFIHCQAKRSDLTFVKNLKFGWIGLTSMERNDHKNARLRANKNVNTNKQPFSQFVRVCDSRIPPCLRRSPRRSHPSDAIKQDPFSSQCFSSEMERVARIVDGGLHQTETWARICVLQHFIYSLVTLGFT